MQQSDQGKKEDSKFILRFDTVDQRARLKARAALNRRTLNAEILFLVEKGMEAVDGTGTAA